MALTAEDIALNDLTELRDDYQGNLTRFKDEVAKAPIEQLSRVFDDIDRVRTWAYAVSLADHTLTHLRQGRTADNQHQLVLQRIVEGAAPNTFQYDGARIAAYTEVSEILRLAIAVAPSNN